MAIFLRILAYYNRKATMTLQEALNSSNMDEIINGMTAYVYSHIKTIGVKDLQGKQPEDFVADVLMKVAEGERDWNKAKCPFKEFLFGCLRSHMNNFFKSYHSTFDDAPPSIGNYDLVKNESDDLKEKAILILIDDDADEDEIAVFECWMDEIKKASEIAIQLNKDVKDVYNISKRLERKIPRLQEKIRKFL